MHRALAMAKRCRLRGGDCTCNRDCEALLQLRILRINKSNELQRIVEAIQRLEAPYAQVVDGWQMPARPQGDYTAVAHFDLGEVSLGWSSETETDDWLDMKCEWPFVEPIAYPDDFEKLGFEVEEE